MNRLLAIFKWNRQWRAAMGLSLAMGLLAGCRAASSAPAAPPSRDAATERSTAGPEAVPSDKAPPQIQAPATVHADPPSSEQAAGFRLSLPAPGNFITQSLPPQNVARYKKWRETWRLPVNQSHLYVAASLGDGEHIIVRSDDEARVRVYNKHSKKLVGNYSLGGQQFDGTAILPWLPNHGDAAGGEDLFLVASAEGLKLVEAATGIIQKILDENSYGQFAWSADAQILVADVRSEPSAPSELRFFQRAGASDLKALGSLKLKERADAWDLSRDNRLLAVAYYPSNNIEIFDLREGSQVAQFVGPDYVGSLSFSPDGRALAIGGRGLLLVDLITPEKRAYYSDFANNISTVQFSPSGDAIVTSSYDGKIRFFDYTLSPANLKLIQTLTHAGTANVYSLEFAPDGNELMSASGDQTVRRFGGPTSKNEPKGSTADASKRFHSIPEWRTLLPAAEQTAPPLIMPSMRDGHYYPPSLGQAPRPSRIKPGKYACKITAIYKLRDCFVTLDEGGHTLLEFANDNLFALKGVLYDDGPVTRYEAWLSEPSSLYDCQGCEQQPLHGIFRGQGSNFSGLLLIRNYYDERSAPPLPSADVKFEEKDDRLPLTLQYRGPLPASSVSSN